MGVAPVGSQKYFTFDGETSKKYNTHITGQGVFNAPVRAVEMVSIPNRNGAFALDQGYFENVELTYKASIAADTATEFAQAVSDLRNWLCSKKGYCRLTDEYNPNEYRMAVYKSGLDVDPFLITSGTFDIVFDCKPQRFLTSGETAVAVTSGNSITNPTLFPSKPQLQVKGYGAIDIGGQEIVVENVMIGIVPVFNEYKRTASGALPYSFGYSLDDVSALNNNDDVIFSGETIKLNFTPIMQGSTLGTCSVTSTSNCSASYSTNSGTSKLLTVVLNDHNFAFGTTDTFTATVDVSMYFRGTAYITQFTIVAQCDALGNISYTMTNTTDLSSTFWQKCEFTVPQLFGNSTKSATGNPLYIDLDIGEVWNEESGTPLSLNNAVQLPAELPVLPSGATTITYDNTFTEFKVLPRWWKV